MISVWTDDVGVMVQLNPGHPPSGFRCTSNYGLIVRSSQEDDETALLLWTSANLADRVVLVRAIEGSNPSFCDIGRVVNSPSDGREHPVGSHLALVPDATTTGYCRSGGTGDVLPLLLEE